MLKFTQNVAFQKDIVLSVIQVNLGSQKGLNDSACYDHIHQNGMLYLYNTIKVINST